MSISTSMFMVMNTVVAAAVLVKKEARRVAKEKKKSKHCKIIFRCKAILRQCIVHR